MLQTVDTAVFPGAFFIVAVRSQQPVVLADERRDVAQAVSKAQDICAFWRQATAHLDTAAKQFAGRRAAVYGSGFYGSWICSRIEADVDFKVFLDQNPKLQGGTHFKRPILSPAALDDDVDVVFVGLNPLKARAAIAANVALQRPGLDLVWIDG